MTSWFRPVQHIDETGGNRPSLRPDYTLYTESGWFPADGVVVVSEKGSMTMKLLPLFIQHFNLHVRKYVQECQQLLLTLDGHKPRNGVAWLDKCRELSIDMVKAPANTTHFLQSCDSHVNKAFKSNIRRLRDFFCSAHAMDTRSVSSKLAVGVGVYRGISSWAARKSLEDTGLFPMNYHFLDKFRPLAPSNIGENIKMSGQDRQHEDATPTADTSPSRTPDRETAANIERLVAKHKDRPAELLQIISVEMSKARITNDVVMSIALFATSKEGRREEEATKRQMAEKKRAAAAMRKKLREKTSKTCHNCVTLHESAAGIDVNEGSVGFVDMDE